MEKKLEKSDLLWIATRSVAKGHDEFAVRYGDDLHGHEGQVDEVFEYMEELRDIGKIAFYEKYKEYRLY